MRHIALAAALLLAGCTPYTPHYGQSHWIHESLTRCSAQIYYPPSYPCGALSVELIKDAGGVRMYVNLLLLPLCPDEASSGYFTFDLTIDGLPYQAKATILAGGQRLLFDEASMNQLINAFLADKAVYIQAGMHGTEVCPHGFAQAYNAIMTKRSQSY